MDHNVTIGAKVKAFRTAKKYTLKQLSEESGLSIGFLSQLERGLSSIAIDSLAKLAAILGVSLRSLTPPPIRRNPRSAGVLPCTVPRSTPRSYSTWSMEMHRDSPVFRVSST